MGKYQKKKKKSDNASIELEIKKVGRWYPSLKKTFLYGDCEYNEKWADANKYLPADFDLVWCKIQDMPKPLTGWHTGTGWDGLKMQPEYKVLSWKMNYDT